MRWFDLKRGPAAAAAASSPRARDGRFGYPPAGSLPDPAPVVCPTTPKFLRYYKRNQDPDQLDSDFRPRYIGDLDERFGSTLNPAPWPLSAVGKAPPRAKSPGSLFRLDIVRSSRKKVIGRLRMRARMQPVGQIPGAELDRVRGIFMDIDDTLTTDGQLGAQAYCALERLHRAGLVSIPITGRPAGWCDHIARMWPVDAVVGENGAFYFCYDRERRRMHKRFLHDDAVREQHRGRLERLAIAILSEVPGSGVASDQPYRESDLAIDYCEDVPPLPAQQIDKIVDMFERAGATAKVSSIHVNGWFGTYDKLGMTKLLMQERFGVDLDRDKGRYIFVGDSPNDAPMFEYFPASVGVANVSDFCERLAVAPAYVTDARSGAGFSELAELVLARGRGHGSGSGLP